MAFHCVRLCPFNCPQSLTKLEILENVYFKGKIVHIQCFAFKVFVYYVHKTRNYKYTTLTNNPFKPLWFMQCAFLLWRKLIPEKRKPI